MRNKTNMNYQTALIKIQKLHKQFSSRYKIKHSELAYLINEMWSYDYPPDILEFTKQAEALSMEFDYNFSEDELQRIYEMDIKQAALYLSNYLKND
jgi:hypothetical protein